MYKLRSERIRTHLHISTLVIVICLLILTTSLIFKSYQSYQKANYTLLEIQTLMVMSDLSQAMLSERLPINLVHHASAETQAIYQAQLQQHRDRVDLEIQQTIQILQASGFSEIAHQLKNEVTPHLENARADFDRYIKMPPQQRTQQRLMQDLQSLFNVWEKTHTLLKKKLLESRAYGMESTYHYAMLLLICDLQDQTSRITSFLKAPVTCSEKINEQQRIATLKQLYQVEYLWKLIGNIEYMGAKDAAFQKYYQALEIQLLQNNKQLIDTLLQQSSQAQPYSYTTQEMTMIAVQSSAAVLDLQNYVLKTRLAVVEARKQGAQRDFIVSCLILFLCLGAVIFTFLYVRHQVFLPLVLARNTLLDLVDPANKHDLNDSVTLLDAIERMKQTLQQRDALAFKLKNIANTDALTGVSNRVALDEYLKLKNHPSQAFSDTALIIVDIDNFKQVNDQYGHLVGDDVIRHIAQQLQANVRSTDLVVRYGGDEFVVILEKCAFGDALYIGDKIRCAISHHPVQVEGYEDLRVSVSAGVAFGGDSWKQLLAKADQSLLRVKASGKNAVEG